MDKEKWERNVEDEDRGVRGGGGSRMELGEDGGGVCGRESLRYKRSERKYVGEKKC